MSKPERWHFEPGGGHAHNRIVSTESVQTHGWPERINGISNASYSDRVCENLGDPKLPGPARRIRLIIAAPQLLDALKAMKDAPFQDDPHIMDDAYRTASALIAEVEGEGG